MSGIECRGIRTLPFGSDAETPISKNFRMLEKSFGPTKDPLGFFTLSKEKNRFGFTLSRKNPQLGYRFLLIWWFSCTKMHISCTKNNLSNSCTKWQLFWFHVPKTNLFDFKYQKNPMIRAHGPLRAFAFSKKTTCFFTKKIVVFLAYTQSWNCFFGDHTV